MVRGGADSPSVTRSNCGNLLKPRPPRPVERQGAAPASGRAGLELALQSSLLDLTSFRPHVTLVSSGIPLVDILIDRDPSLSTVVVEGLPSNR